MATTVIILGIAQLVMMLTPQGPRGLTERVLSTGVAAGSVVIASLWLRPWWPTRRQSVLCGVLAAFCIAVGCLIMANPVIGLFGCIAFAVVNEIARLLHSGRLLTVTGTVTAVTVGVLAVRVGQMDTALAVAGAVVVGIVNVVATAVPKVMVDVVGAQALNDEIEPLTGLLSRRGFEAQLATLIGARTRDDDRYLVVLLVSIDSFSMITGMRGEVGGKRARVTVAQGLRECVRRNAIVGHLPEAEFVIAELFTTPDPTPLAERVRGAMTAAPIRLTASVGAVSTPLRPLSGVPPPELLDEILSIAGEAVQGVRQDGGNGFVHISSPELDVTGRADGAA